MCQLPHQQHHLQHPSLYIVEKILDKRKRNGRVEYLLKWKEFPEEDSTWEKTENIFAPHLIQSFEAEYEQKNKKKKRGRPPLHPPASSPSPSPSSPTTTTPTTPQNQKVKQKAKKSFFHDWPSFGVSHHLSVVLQATGYSFLFGFKLGAEIAANLFFKLYMESQKAAFAAGLMAATATAAVVSPNVLLSAVKYIVIGGLSGGAATATPVFVIGSTGVFVSATLFHAFHLSKRLIQSQFQSHEDEEGEGEEGKGKEKEAERKVVHHHQSHHQVSPSPSATTITITTGSGGTTTVTVNKTQ
eukprot:TRINITY_DN993_c0_g4_i2.p1 TRINITY_DN993_c0_g4~~TRINITY_DN993_c0_g4_i2.p1  ORF type:complete len:299 (-),score=109.12 TRINITY_DN993_c0_g4_i2:167-1063(-)